MKSDIPTTAIVLAGGLGTRLRLTVTDRPKTLALAAGKPFLSYVLGYLARQNIQQVALSVGYLAGQVKSFAGDGRNWGLEIMYSEEQAPLGTGGALRQASQGFAFPFF
ncbi:MAG TPA: sugar phosphate nucleotidyltransferase, partial [Anaerolineales bacterium]